jgi:hypothetical protein
MMKDLIQKLTAFEEESNDVEEEHTLPSSSKNLLGDQTKIV